MTVLRARADLYCKQVFYRILSTEYELIRSKMDKELL